MGMKMSRRRRSIDNSSSTALLVVTVSKDLVKTAESKF